MLYDLDQIRGYYRKLIQGKDPDYFERFDHFLLDKRPEVRGLIEKAFDRMLPDGAGKLLDVGCGTCFYFPLLAKHADSILGVDVCVPMIEQARELIATKGLTNCSVMEHSALELPFEDGSFDTVHSWDFLHHVPDLPRAVAEIARVVRPGGRYVATEPNLLNPSIFWYHLRRRVEWGLFSKNQFRIPRLLRKHGFEVKLRFDNTIISFLNERTWKLWKFIDGFTRLWPFRPLSFRYVIECTKRA
ncbi:MAG: class I SAM-dependent methyltransferase [Planctomycetota bacterium]